jgi:hypothetical protein
VLGEGAGLPVDQVQVHLPQPARQGVRRAGVRGLREEVQPGLPLRQLSHRQTHAAAVAADGEADHHQYHKADPEADTNKAYNAK